MQDKNRKDFNSFAKSMGISSLNLDYYQRNTNGFVTPKGSYINPTILEERQLNVTQMDVFSRLMVDNIIFLGTGINDDVANIINAQLLYLSSKDDKARVSLYINSPGGGIYAGLSILDTMNFIPNPVDTITCGMAASMGFVLASAGAHRSGLKHSRFLLHQPLGGAEGQASDMEIVVKQIKALKKELYEIISENTKQSFEKIEKDGDRDYWMTAEEAKAYGAIDEVIDRKK